MPATQLAHAVAFAADANCPLEQLLHQTEPALSEYLPALHVEQVEEPASAIKVPAAHLVHEVTIWPDEYWPAAQGLHATPFSLNSPALQSVAEHELAPAVLEPVPGAQAVHAVALPVE